MLVSCAAVSLVFGRASLNIEEGEEGMMCVNITGELERSISVNVSVDSISTAIPGVDFDPIDLTLTFNSTVDSMCFPINTLPDNVFEANEIILLNLSSSDGQASFGTPTYTQITILDNTDGTYVCVCVCTVLIHKAWFKI